MIRRDALLRLHKSLVARRNELRRRLGEELGELRGSTASATGDVADMAFDTGSEEVYSQLAELESRELEQIEHALVRLRSGTYGICESCREKIPLARLNALPLSTTCVACQREMEVLPSRGGRVRSRNWERVSKTHTFADQPEMELSKFDWALSGQHR